MPFNHFMTPPTIIEDVRAFFGGTIDLDPASNPVAQRYVRASKWCTLNDELLQNTRQPVPDNMQLDGLSIPWFGNVFCNPPYSNGDIDAFTAQALNNVAAGTTQQLVYLVNSQTDTRWYHACLSMCSAALLVKGRIKFWKIFDDEAHEKWEGEVSKKRRLEDPTLEPVIGNNPRYLSTIFYFGRHTDRFSAYFERYGTIVAVHPFN